MKYLLIMFLITLLLWNFYINLMEVPGYTEMHVISVLVILAVKHIRDKQQEVER